MQIINGQEVSAKLKNELAAQVAALKPRLGRSPKLAAIQVGSLPASQIYLKNKALAAKGVGIDFELFQFPTTPDVTSIVKNQIEKLNQSNEVDGILLQLPTPAGVDGASLIAVINPAKDVDGLTQASQGALLQGRPGFVSCTPLGIMTLLKESGVMMAKKHVVVVGRSLVVGKPMALLALNQDATVSICHSQTVNLGQITQTGDIVIVAAGKPQILGRDDFKRGAVVVDVGIHRLESGLCGDVRADELTDWVQALTPVPKGVGPMTIWALLNNTYLAAAQRVTK